MRSHDLRSPAPHPLFDHLARTTQVIEPLTSDQSHINFPFWEDFTPRIENVNLPKWEFFRRA